LRRVYNAVSCPDLVLSADFLRRVGMIAYLGEKLWRILAWFLRFSQKAELSGVLSWNFRRCVCLPVFLLFLPEVVGYLRVFCIAGAFAGQFWYGFCHFAVIFGICPHFCQR
jgi:hypothetical protein